MSASEFPAPIWTLAAMTAIARPVSTAIGTVTTSIAIEKSSGNGASAQAAGNLHRQHERGSFRASFLRVQLASALPQPHDGRLGTSSTNRHSDQNEMIMQLLAHMEADKFDVISGSFLQ
jgi:hypothetical protein